MDLVQSDSKEIVSEVDFGPDREAHRRLTELGKLSIDTLVSPHKEFRLQPHRLPLRICPRNCPLEIFGRDFTGC